MARTLLTAAGLLASLFASSPTWAHAHLETSNPSDRSTVTSPAQIKLQFTEDLEPSFSDFNVSSSGGEDVPLTKIISEDGTLLVRVPAHALVSGSYNVRWHVLSKDGHATSGSYSFVVKP